MGAGTGILAIAALLSGAEQATGLDIEEDAVTDAGGNVIRNGVDERYTSLLRTKETEAALPDGVFDLVICHITADAILKDLPLLKRKTAQGGKILLGGIRTDREADVTSELVRMQLEVHSAFRDTEWVTLVCEKRKKA
jgi:ribosomal protein L11 methyltransferase